MTGTQIVLVFAIIGVVFVAALATDLLITWTRARREGRLPERLVRPSIPPWSSASFRDVLTDEVRWLGKEFGGVLQLLRAVLAAITWMDAMGARVPLDIALRTVGPDAARFGQRLACASPFVLLVNGGRGDWVLTLASALAFVLAGPRMLFAVWTAVVVAILPSDHLAILLVLGAAGVFAARRSYDEAIAVTACIVAASYGLLAPALATCAILTPVRKSVLVSAWTALSLPLLQWRGILDPDQQPRAATVIDFAAELRHALADWIAVGPAGSQPVASLIESLTVPIERYSASAQLLGTPILLVLGLGVLVPVFERARRSAFHRSRTAGAATRWLVLLAVAFSITSASLGTFLPALLGGIAAIAMVGRAAEDQPRTIPYYVESLARSILGVWADLSTALALVFIGIYVGDFGTDALVVADVILFFAAGSLGVGVGWAEHAGERIGANDRQHSPKYQPAAA